MTFRKILAGLSLGLCLPGCQRADDGRPKPPQQEGVVIIDGKNVPKTDAEWEAMTEVPAFQQ
jgi:hypothetical protein